MTREFPETPNYSSAFSFAIEVERACADLAAAAGVLAPDDVWQAKLEELVCTHDDRVAKLSDKRGTGQAHSRALDGRNYLSTLTAEPEISWPAAVRQLALAEEDAARYHEAFAIAYADALGDAANLFKKTAQQERTAAQELRAMLD